MELCTNHQDMLRAALVARGAGHLIDEAATQDERQQSHDTLLGATLTICKQAVDLGGVCLLLGNPCPICEAVTHLADKLGPDQQPVGAPHVEHDWTDGPAHAVAHEWTERGWLTPLQ